jgi:mannan endo-1,4-beta-mannosidase
MSRSRALRPVSKNPNRHGITRARPLLVVAALVSAACSSAIAPAGIGDAGPEQERETLYVEGRKLFDRCGEEVVLRGVNRMVVWMDREGATLPEIARTGANTVRIVWSVAAPPAAMATPISVAIENGMIPMIELHDATGKWERLPELVDYWIRPQTVEVLGRFEADLLVNIANEAGDRSVTDDQFREGYREAIQRMRAAGIRSPLVIDAANWGRAEGQLLRTAPYLLAADPHRNLIFSVHWWHSDNDTARITSTFEEAVQRDIPFIVGEFAHAEVGCKGRIAYEHIMKEGQRLGIGWLAWSWGPGNSDCPAMDMTRDSRFETLHGWGLEVAVTDPNSITNTSVRPHSIVHGECRG